MRKVLFAFLLLLFTSAQSKADKVLFCARVGVDFFLGISLASCMDSNLEIYQMSYASVGIGVGIQFNVFTLIYHSSSRRPISGQYLGGRGSLAYGLTGGSLGYFWRHGDPSDQIYWVGYAAGAGIDLDASMIFIQKAI